MKKALICAVLALTAAACHCHESDAPFSGLLCNEGHKHHAAGPVPGPTPCDRDDDRKCDD